MSGSNKLVETPFYKNMVKYIDINNFNKIVNNFIPLLERSYLSGINNILLNLPDEWRLTPKLGIRIDKFLNNKPHIDRVKNIMLNSKL